MPQHVVTYLPASALFLSIWPCDEGYAAACSPSARLLALSLLARPRGMRGISACVSQSANRMCYVYATACHRLPIKSLLEFDRDRKSMSVLCAGPNPSSNVLLVKGAAECVLDRSSK